MNNESLLLRRTLQANGAFSLACGALLIPFGAPLAAWMGLPHPIWLWALAPGLITFGALVFALGRRPRVPVNPARLVTWLDWGWVASSAGVLVFLGAYLSTPGQWLVADTAVIVAIFAALQQLGLHRTVTPARAD